MIKKIKQFDLEKKIKEFWYSISPVSKKSFFLIFGIVNLVFLWHTITFLHGDHDWDYIINGNRLFSHIFQGRFTSGLPLLLLNGDILPIFNNLFSFFGFSLAIIYLAKYWYVPKTVFSYVFFSLFIILMPYTLSWLWYIFLTSNFWFLFLIMYAFNNSLRKDFSRHFFVILLFIISLGGFASCISTICIVFLGRCLLDIVVYEKSLKELIKEYKYTILDILISSIIFLGIFYTLKIKGLLLSDYHSQIISAEDIIKKLLLLPRVITQSFYIPVSFFPFQLKLFILIPIILFLVNLFFNRKLQSILLIFFILLTILFCSQLTLMMAKENLIHQTRIDFYSMPYIYALIYVILLLKKGIFKSVAIFVMGISIFVFTLENIKAQKVWFFEREQEINIYKEIVAQIRTNEELNINQRYNLLLIGHPTKRGDFDTSNKNIKRYHGHHQEVFLPNWSALSFIKNNLNLKQINKIYSVGNPLSDKDLLNMNIDFEKMSLWPNKNSIIIKDNIICIAFSNEELQKMILRTKELKMK